MSVQDLPHLNAALNTLAAVFMIAGFVLIRKKRVLAHRACMLAATGVSAAFLASYLVYHYNVGHVKFPGEGAVKTVYFVLLASHVVLAIAVPPLVGAAIFFGLTNRIARHKKLVRFAYPIWLYVSVTGVIVYIMLYHVYTVP